MKVGAGGARSRVAERGARLWRCSGLTADNFTAAASPALGTPAKGRDDLVLQHLQAQRRDTATRWKSSRFREGAAPPLAAISRQARFPAGKISKCQLSSNLESDAHLRLHRNGRRQTSSVVRAQSNGRQRDAPGHRNRHLPWQVHRSAGQRGYTAAEATTLPGEILRLPDAVRRLSAVTARAGRCRASLRTTKLVARARGPARLARIRRLRRSDGGVRFGFSASLRRRTRGRWRSLARLASSGAASVVRQLARRSRPARRASAEAAGAVRRRRLAPASSTGGPRTWTGPLDVSGYRERPVRRRSGRARLLLAASADDALICCGVQGRPSAPLSTGHGSSGQRLPVPGLLGGEALLVEVAAELVELGGSTL